MQNTSGDILEAFIEKNATDLYLTVGSSPCMRILGALEYLPTDLLKEEEIRRIMRDLLNDRMVSEFDADWEYNTAITWKNTARLRLNLFRQKQYPGIVIRRIQTQIPVLTELNVPKIYGDLIMEKRGLILVVGPTGSGKSTSLAAMLGHRNTNGSGHIITIEDPIEFEHTHKQCIITQRDVGIDTKSFNMALKNALRQMPDVIAIGEIRDRDTMESAISFAEAGHLCIATLHANNSSQAIERIINFFPTEQHAQIASNLSLTLKAILSQRLVSTKENAKILATEIMLNAGHIRELIAENKIKEIREHIEKGKGLGMQTFEQALMELFQKHIISEETALAEADSPANLRLAIRELGLGSYRPSPELLRRSESSIDKKQF